MMHRLLFLALAGAACARGGVPADATPAGQEQPAAADTLRGTLDMTGSEPGVIFVVVDAAGRAAELEGERAFLQQFLGLEVVVEGTRVGEKTFRVTDVKVRAAEGVPAVDGVLAREGSRDVLVMRDGSRRTVARLPEALRGRVGDRIWLSGPLDGDIVSFGVIANRR